MHRDVSSLSNRNNQYQEKRAGRAWLVFAMLGMAALMSLSACVAASPLAEHMESESSTGNSRLSAITKYDLPTPEAVIVPNVKAVVNTVGSRANVRSGPSTRSSIVAKALPGEEYTVIGASDDERWLEVCCVEGQSDAEGEATEHAWLSVSVVDLDGNADAVPAVESVLPESVESTWQVEWSCGSERCEVKECNASVTASADAKPNDQWMDVEHIVSWDDECFEEDSWVFEVDRFTAKERSGEYADNFLYNYWLGVQPGPATNIFEMDDGREIAVWCSGPHELELEENDGWVTKYVGETCHDVKTGELVSVSYTKRWLFTGEYNGQKYEQAYFGDYEVLDQYLVDSNIELGYVGD